MKISVAQAAKILNLTVQSVYAIVKREELKATTKEYGNFSLMELNEDEVLQLRDERELQRQSEPPRGESC